MNMDELVKYLIWAVFFAGALYGIYKLLGGLGVV